MIHLSTSISKSIAFHFDIHITPSPTSLCYPHHHQIHRNATQHILHRTRIVSSHNIAHHRIIGFLSVGGPPLVVAKECWGVGGRAKWLYPPPKRLSVREGKERGRQRLHRQREKERKIIHVISSPLMGLNSTSSHGM